MTPIQRAIADMADESARIDAEVDRVTKEAAAEEMYEALKLAVAAFGDFYGFPIEQAKAALAKAEGR